MRHLTRMRAIVAAGGAGLLVAGAVTAATAASAGTGPARAAIAGTHPSWATATAKVAAATVPATQQVNAYVYLAGQDPAGLAAYAREVATPGSAQYGHYLSAAQTMARFGPTASQVSSVTNWLTGAGLKVTKVSDMIGGYVQVSGTTAQAAKAFGVTFGMYKSTAKGTNGKTFRAPDQAATAPAAVSADVLSVAGLDTAPHLAKPADTLPPPGQNYWVDKPCNSYYDQSYAAAEPSAYGKKWPWAVCGYTPKQIRGAYGVAAAGKTGKGVTVAVVDAYASRTMATDANDYAKATGDSGFKPGQYKEYLLGGTDGWTNTSGCGDWSGEESLDVESVHGMAPDAKVHYVGAVSCTDVDLGNALATIVNKHLADIVTNSWGETADSSAVSYDQIFEAGAAEGIGFFFSSGDSGYEDPAYEDGGSDKIQVDYPTSSPWVTSVGGTSLAIGKSNNYEFETSWGTALNKLSADGKSWTGTMPGSYGGSGGGGVSTTYAQPFYQRGTVPATLATSLPDGTTSSSPMRVVPDVSALADPSTGIAVGQTLYQPDGTTLKFSMSRIGGTSLASPVFAGIEADAQQAAGHPLGFANPVIYALAHRGAFRDVSDHPFGPGPLAQVRNNYASPYTASGGDVTWLRTLGVNGTGASALPAVRGYDDSTGVGSPKSYIQSFQHR